MQTMKWISLIVLSIFLFSLMQISYAAKLPTPIGKVAWVKGDSFKATMNNLEVRILQKESVIYLGDVLMTSDSTTAEIVLSDKTLMTFKPNTKFSIDEYQFHSRKNNSSGKIIMNLIEGGFRTITGLISKTNPDDYQVKTAIATIGIRGTDFAVYIENGKLYMERYKGTPCLSQLKKTNEAENKNLTKDEIKKEEAKKKLCLDKEHPYGVVDKAGGEPEYTSEQPEGFKEKLEITDASFDLFPPDNNSPTSAKQNQDSGGSTSSFCIQ